MIAICYDCKTKGIFGNLWTFKFIPDPGQLRKYGGTFTARVKTGKFVQICPDDSRKREDKGKVSKHAQMFSRQHPYIDEED